MCARTATSRRRYHENEPEFFIHVAEKSEPERPAKPIAVRARMHGRLRHMGVLTTGPCDRWA